MRLLTLEAAGVRGVEDGRYDLAGDLVAVHGARGAGTARFLRAIALAKEAIGSYAFRPDLEDWTLAGARESWLGTRWALNDSEQRLTGTTARELEARVRLPGGPEATEGVAQLAQLLGRFDCSGGAGGMELFPAHREWEPGQRGRSILLDPSLHLSPEGAKYAGLEQLLAEEWINAQMHGEQRGGPQSMARAIEDLAPGLHLESAEVQEGRTTLWFNRGATRCELEELEPAEQQAVLFAAVIRGLGLRHSILLIEEPELHWSEPEQARWVRALAALEPTNQLILATSSAAVAELARPCVTLRRADPR